MALSILELVEVLGARNLRLLDSRPEREQQDPSKVLLLASRKHTGNVPAPSIFDWLVDKKREKKISFVG